jgi:hypothetical protein
VATYVDCDLRKLLVRMFAKRVTAGWFTKNKGAYQIEFYTDLMLVLLQERERKETLQVTLGRLHAAIEAGDGL